MDRLTGKEVNSMMGALAQVYEQQEVISENELGFKNGGGNAAMQKYIKNGMSATQARMRVETDGAKYTLQQRARERETARVNRDRTIQQAGGGAAGEAERKAGKEAQYAKEFPKGTYKSDMERKRTSAGAIDVDAKYRTRQTGESNLRRLGDGDLDKGIEIFRKQQAAAKAKTETEKDKTNNGMTAAEIKAAQDAANKARRDGKLSDLRGGGGNTTASTPKPTPKPTKTYTIGGKTYSSKAEINKEYDRLRKSGGDAKAFGDKAFKATNKPAIGTTPGGTKFERRAPTSAELRAAQAARAAGKGETGAIKAGVQQAQRQASVNAAVKSANRPSVLNKPAPTGSALRAQQDQLAQKNKIQREVAAVKSGMPANTQSSANNPVKKSLVQSADLFDIVKGQFIEEGYSEEDTMYMMANLNEEQLQEFLRQLAGVAIRNANKVPGIKRLVTKVGGMFNKTSKSKIGSGDIGALRLYQDKANQSLQKLNRGMSTSKANDATRTATREKTRLNNLDPRAVSDRNAREAAAQAMQRNVEKGRPSFAGPQPVDRLDYKPGDPQFTKSLKRYYADKRAGTRGLPD